MTYTLVAGPATISDGQVSFDFTGDPLPPTMDLELVSEPAGIAFRPDGRRHLTCASTRSFPTWARSGAGAFAPHARLVAAVTGGSVTESIPLSE